ncbi:MAG: transposase family protein [Thermodesulfobacteriota bacterium]|nr:transposase family protein [Thermodesulfobacteriota bacterium]
MKKPTPTIAAHFTDLKDPRIEGKNRHLLIDIIAITTCSVIAVSTFTKLFFAIKTQKTAY